jgi:hypothetical protein
MQLAYNLTIVSENTLIFFLKRTYPCDSRGVCGTFFAVTDNKIMAVQICIIFTDCKRKNKNFILV